MTTPNGRGCPVCRAPAWMMWVEQRRCVAVECDVCTTFTITTERLRAFRQAWRQDDRAILLRLEQLSRYLRRAGDEGERAVTEASWLALAIEGAHRDDD